MVNSSPEVALKLVEEILINFEKNLVSKERDTAEDLAWALWSLTETGNSLFFYIFYIIF